MAKDRSVSTKAIPPPARKDGDRKEVGNLILLALPRNECTQIFPSLEFVRLNLHHVMHEAGEVIKSAYFLNSGMASVLTVLPDGKSVEVGLIGKEGFVGLPVVFGFKTSPLRVVIQADATGYRVDVTTLRKFLPECPELEKQLQRFAMIPFDFIEGCATKPDHVAFDACNAGAMHRADTRRAIPCLDEHVTPTGWWAT